jgi:pimeloyl-ACP methyl ester carboxylesterase
MLDSAVLPPQRFIEFLQPFSEAMRTPDYREALLRFFGYAFAPADDPGRKERILERMSLAPQNVARQAWESVFSTWDGASAAAACEAPILYVDHGSPNCDLARLRDLCPQLLDGKTVGAGHWAMLETPEQVDAMIVRFLEVSGL